MAKSYDCIIIGEGPCGIGCACALHDAGINFAMIEKGAPGGKVNIAPRVDNYPRQTKIPGPELAFIFYQRVVERGIEVIGDEVKSLTKEDGNFKIQLENDIVFAKTVLLASGTTERKLGLDKEDKLLGHGVSYCALCDGHFFVGKDVLVVGGGNSALKEAIYLAKRVKHLTLIHRRDQFRGLNHLVDELKENENVDVLTPYIPLEILGDDRVIGVRIKNVATNEEKIINVDGLFPLVGQIPNTQFINIDGVKDEWNTVPVDKRMQTSCEGLFAGGDILPREIRQIYLAEHDGMVAAKSIIEFLGK